MNEKADACREKEHMYLFFNILCKVSIFRKLIEEQR